MAHQVPSWYHAFDCGFSPVIVPETLCEYMAKPMSAACTGTAGATKPQMSNTPSRAPRGTETVAALGANKRPNERRCIMKSVLGKGRSRNARGERVQEFLRVHAPSI